MSRYDDIKDQLERYGGEPCDQVLSLLDIIADLNDDIAHIRSTDCIAECVARAKAELDKIQTDYVP